MDVIVVMDVVVVVDVVVVDVVVVDVASFVTTLVLLLSMITSSSSFSFRCCFWGSVFLAVDD